MPQKHRIATFTFAGILSVLILSLSSNPVFGKNQITRFRNEIRLTQSIEDRMKATLEEANQSLGGGFVWDKSTYYTFARPSKKVGVNDVDYPVYLTEYLIARLYEPNKFCNSILGEYWKPATFHGMPGCQYLEGSHIAGVIWEIPDGIDENGNQIVLEASTNIGYSCNGNKPENERKAGCGSLNALPLAEALHQAAIHNGLYEPIPEEDLPVALEEIPPIELEEILPGQPEASAEQSISPDSSESNEADDLFGISAAIVLGSLGVPIAGAMAGALISSLASLLSSSSSTASAAQSAAIPNPVTQNYQDLYWSERPWDEAGPGYVTKEEYEHTQQMLDQGYKWTKDGWQTPDQIQQSDQWQQNNQAAVAREDAEWQAQQQAEQQALQQNEAELQKSAEELDKLQAETNFIDMKNDLETINQGLLDENIYVANPLQGDPTLIVDGISKVANIGWDITAGWVTHSTGFTCGDYVSDTLGKVKRIITEKYGPGAKVEGYVFEEKSTRNPQEVLDWFDKLNDDNHNLIKVTLPDGSEWAVDFHQHNTGKRPPILRPWKEARQVWKDYLGDEFMERISVH